jgi:hypothetical protein
MHRWASLALSPVTERLVRLASAKLGRCAKCMRLSLVLGLVGWAGVLVAWQLSIPPPGYGVLVFLAAGLSALWVTHVAVFGARMVIFKREMGRRAEPRAEGILPVVFAHRGRHLNRREALRVFGQGAGLAVLVSLAFPVRVRADQCGCPDGFISCPGIPNCCPSAIPWHCGSKLLVRGARQLQTLPRWEHSRSNCESEGLLRRHAGLLPRHLLIELRVPDSGGGAKHLRRHLRSSNA